MTEKLFTGTLRINQPNIQFNTLEFSYILAARNDVTRIVKMEPVTKTRHADWVVRLTPGDTTAAKPVASTVGRPQTTLRHHATDKDSASLDARQT